MVGVDSIFFTAGYCDFDIHGRVLLLVYHFLTFSVNFSKYWEFESIEERMPGGLPAYGRLNAVRTFNSQNGKK